MRTLRCGKAWEQKGLPRREHVRSKPTLSEAPPPPVKVAVVTSPQTQDGGPSLRGDVRLVKAALLYADQVELLGLAASMVHAIGLAPGSGTLSLDRLVRLSEIANGGLLMPPEVRTLIPTIEAMIKRGVQLPEEAAKVTEFMAGAHELLGPAQTEILETTGAEELRPALESGIVTVADLGVGMEEAVSAAVSAASNSDRETRQWVDEIKARLADRRTRLLFDEGPGASCS